MAVEPEDDELLTDQEQDEGGNADEQNQEEQEQGSTKPGDEGDEELEIAFGDEAAPASGDDTPLIKHLRAELRETKKQLAENRRSSEPQKIEVGEKPSLAGCEYDEEAYERQLDEWKQRKAQAEQQLTQAEQQNRAAQEAFEADVRKFEARRAELKVPGGEEAIETAMASLNQVQAAVIVKAADNPALVFAALGKHPGKLAEIASIQDPLKQAVAVAKLEATLKLTSRRKAPEPEEVERGGAPRTKATDKDAERLEKRAMEKGGDVSALLKRQREQRRAARAK